MLLIVSFVCFGGVHHSVTCPIWDYLIFCVLFVGKFTLRMIDTSVRKHTWLAVHDCFNKCFSGSPVKRSIRSRTVARVTKLFLCSAAVK